MPFSLDDGKAPPIDRAALAEISNGNGAAERRLLSAFRKANADDTASLNAAVERRDAAAVVRAGHRLLGASKMAGALTLATICASIMRVGETGDWEAITAYRDALKRELERVDAYLDMLLNRS